MSFSLYYLFSQSIPVEGSPLLGGVRVEADAGATTRGSRGSVRGILSHLWGVQEHPCVEREVGGGREVTEVRNTYVLCVSV